MKYIVQLGEAARTIGVEVAGGGRVTIDGVLAEVQLAHVPGTPFYHLLVDGASWTVAVEPLEDGGGEARWALGLAGERVIAQAVDERTYHLRRVSGEEERGRTARSQTGVVAAPMPGLVVRVVVTPGQRVEAGTPLIVLEAMKMENELRASGPGVVSHVHVTVGQAVERGSPLITLG